MLLLAANRKPFHFPGTRAVFTATSVARQLSMQWQVACTMCGTCPWTGGGRMAKINRQGWLLMRLCRCFPSLTVGSSTCKTWKTWRLGEPLPVHQSMSKKSTRWVTGGWVTLFLSPALTATSVWFARCCGLQAPLHLQSSSVQSQGSPVHPRQGSQEACSLKAARQPCPERCHGALDSSRGPPSLGASKATTQLTQTL